MSSLSQPVISLKVFDFYHKASEAYGFLIEKLDVCFEEEENDLRKIKSVGCRCKMTGDLEKINTFYENVHGLTYYFSIFSDFNAPFSFSKKRNEEDPFEMELILIFNPQLDPDEEVLPTLFNA